MENLKAVYTSNNGYDTVTVYTQESGDLLFRYILGSDTNLDKEFLSDLENPNTDWNGANGHANMHYDADGNVIKIEEISNEIVDLNSDLYLKRKAFILGDRS